MNKLLNVSLVFVGGGIGALARYWLQGAAYKFIGSTLPYGTIAVNVAGSLLIGFLMSAFEERILVSPSLRVFLTVGLLGGFTTFSSFSYETIALLRDGEMLYGAMNVLATVVMCLCATYAGMIAGKLL